MTEDKIKLENIPELLSRDHVWEHYLETLTEVQIARLQGTIRMIDQKCKEWTLKKRYQERLGGRY
jgi:hypothetical protein